MDFCANCENQADTFLTITPKLSERQTVLPLCSQCYDAFQWGITHGEAGDNIEESGTIFCSLCENRAKESTAHLHQEQYIGECCWDDRLKASE